jgi:maleylpyruvate isomerase
MLKLYNFHASSTSYRTRIVLNCKGIAYEYVPVRLDKAEHLGAAYGEINPMRGVPTLETDGARLYQSSAIIEYLEEVYPEPAMLPKDAVGRARVRAIAAIVGSDMHPVTNLRVRNFVRDNYKQDADGVNAWIHRWNSQGFEAIEAMLRADTARNPGFCYGTTATVADAYLVSHVFSAVRFKTDIAPYPLIRNVVEHCEQLEPFKQAHPSRQPDAK